MTIKSIESSVTTRGQTVVPAPIRRRHHIQAGDRLVWLDDGQMIRIVPVARSPLSSLRGSGRGERLIDALLKGQKRDRGRRGCRSSRSCSPTNSSLETVGRTQPKSIPLFRVRCGEGRLNCGSLLERLLRELGPNHQNTQLFGQRSQHHVGQESRQSWLALLESLGSAQK